MEALKRYAIHYFVRDSGVIRKLVSIGILPISAIGIDIILKDAILQLEVHQPKRIVSQKKR